ncbi:hypothetical protein ACFUCT_23185 [Streptomyces parvus]|uniref:hypothetical protein n=1 Tax=Streptomyces parvus TaxID=66428 RepID=UPI00363EB890
MTALELDPDFVANASVDAIRTQYERAERMAELWADRARELFLLLSERRSHDDAPLPLLPCPAQGNRSVPLPGLLVQPPDGHQAGAPPA